MEQPIASSPTAKEAQPRLELTKELIVSLSREIETTMKGITEFRTKIAFGMFAGPFVLLGSQIVAAKGQPFSLTLPSMAWLILGIAGGCFLLIGFIAAKVEAQAIDQCDEWRILIEELRQDPTVPIDTKRLRVKHKAHEAYLITFFLALVFVVAAVVIIKNMRTVEAQKPAGPAGTYRLEQISP